MVTLEYMVRAIVRDEIQALEHLRNEDAPPKGEHLRGAKLPPNGTEIGSLPPALKFDDVKKAFIAMMKRDAALGQPLLDKFGIKLLSAAKPEQYADIIKACA